MGTLDDFRSQHPEYSWASDHELAGKLHEKFYAEIPRDQFMSRVGMKDQVAEMNLGRHGADWKSAKAEIDTLPEADRARARDAWADAHVAEQRKDGGVMQRIDDSVRTVASHIPGVGKWADELNAKTAEYLGGQDYEMAHAHQRAIDRAIENEKTTHLATLPTVKLPLIGEVGGDITTRSLEKAAGTIGGAVAMPMARVVGGAGVIPTGVNVGLNSAAYAASDAAGEADAGKRADAAAHGAAAGGLTGLVLGGAVGKLAGREAAPVARPIAEAAKTLGVDIPRAVALDDSVLATGLKQAAGATSAMPFAGAPMRNASVKAIEDLNSKAAEIAEQFHPGATHQGAGEASTAAISDWIKGRSAEQTKEVFGRVRALVPDDAAFPLVNTKATAEHLVQLDRDAASSVNHGAVKMVEEAVKRDAMSIDGMMQLRTNVGAMLGDALLPDAGTVKPALKQIYGALTQDIADTMRAYGGPAAEQAWRRANQYAQTVADQREALTKIIGKDGEKAGEGVVDTLVRMAGSRSTGDAAKLNLARKTIGDEAWKEVSAVSIQRLGRAADGEFNLSRFTTNYKALSDAGRHALFSSNPELRMQLDSLAALGDRFKDLHKFVNTSNTGSVLALASGLSGIFVHPMSAIGTFVPSWALSKWMSQPAKVRQITNFGEAVHDLLKGKGSGDAVGQALTAIAHSVAEETGEKPEAVVRRAMGKQAPQPAAPQSHGNALLAPAAPQVGTIQPPPVRGPQIDHSARVNAINQLLQQRGHDRVRGLIDQLPTGTPKPDDNALLR